MLSPHLHLVLILWVGCTQASTILEEETSIFVGSETSFCIKFNFSEFESTFSWKFKGKPILVHDPNEDGHERNEGHYTSVINSNGTVISLNLQNARFNDAGRYTCSKIFFTAGRTEEGSFLLKVQGRPKLQISSTTPTENDAIWAKCCVDYSKESEDPVVEWLFHPELHNFSVSSKISRETLGKDKDTMCDTVTFSAERFHHNKSLNCVVQNTLKASSAVVMHVQYSSTVRIVGPLYFLIDEKSDLNITCVSEGNPPPIVTLQYHVSHDEWSDREVERIATLGGETTSVIIFHIYNIIRDQAGKYRCSAFNRIGHLAVSRALQLEVTYLDEVEMLTPSPYLVEKTGKINISCRVHGNAYHSLTLQVSIVNDYWVTRQLNPFNISKETEFSTWQFHLSAESYDGAHFRCVANSTKTEFIASEILEVKYQSLLDIIKDMTLSHIEIIIAFILGITIATILVCVKCNKKSTTPHHPNVASDSRYNNENVGAVVSGDSYTPRYPLVPTIRRPVPAPPIMEENRRDNEDKNENYDELSEYQREDSVQNENFALQSNVVTAKYATVSK